MVSALLAKAGSRFYARHPWQLVLAVAGIGLGVAVYVGIELANDSARRAFELSADAVVGITTHRLLPVGGALPEAAYRDLVIERGITRAAPIVETTLKLAALPERSYSLLGVDPIKESAVRGFVATPAVTRQDVEALLITPNAVLLPASLLAETGLHVGDEVPADIGGRGTTITIGGVLSETTGETEIAIADIVTAQELSGRDGSIDRVDLRIGDAEARRLSAAPPEGTTLVSVQDERSRFTELTRAFRTNLTALGLLALAVGMFLIYSTMSFAIVQRRQVFGALVAIGLDRRQLLIVVIGEALILGLTATALGLALGHWLAQSLVDLVLRTLGDLYFSARVSAADPSAWIYVRGLAFGIGATLIAALGPAVDAAQTAPASTMRRASLERSVGRRMRLAGWLALPTLLVAIVAVSISGRSLYVGFAALFCVLAAGAMLTPTATRTLMRLLEPIVAAVFGLTGRLALRGVTGSLSRTGVATAALTVAVASVIGIGLMIASFRASVIDWLQSTLNADLYVSFAEEGSVNNAVVDRLEGLAGIAEISRTRYTELATPNGMIGLRALQPGRSGWGLQLVQGANTDLAALEATDAVAVSEAFAFRRQIGLGDRLSLPTPLGLRPFEVVAIFRDYNAGGSAAIMSLARYRQIWADDSVGSIGVTLTGTVGAREVGREIISALPSGARPRMRSTAGLIDLSLEIFDRTFRITEVLRLLAGIIAFLGVLSSLLSIQLEKAHEQAVLRAIGFSPGQLATAGFAQTLLLGLAAGLAALPIGVGLAALLVHVINRRSFGWTMDLSLPAAPMLAGVALAIGAAALAGLIPAAQQRRTSIAAALRAE